MHEFVMLVKNKQRTYKAYTLEDVYEQIEVSDPLDTSEIKFVSFTSSEYLNRKEEIDDKVRAYEMAMAYQGNRAEDGS